MPTRVSSGPTDLSSERVNRVSFLTVKEETNDVSILPRLSPVWSDVPAP